MNPFKNCLRLAMAAALLLQGIAADAKLTFSKSSPFNINLSRQYGEITQFSDPHPGTTPKPEFILIQNVHCNKFVQIGISNLLKQLKAQNLLPERLGIEGAAGPIDLSRMRQQLNPKARRKSADYSVAEGEMTGAMHFVVSEGAGDLYGVENARLYDTAVKMFQRSYIARAELSRDLEKLEAALTLLYADRRVANNATILAQDVKVLHRLLDQQLTPEELHPVVNHAVFAVDHLKHIVSKRMGKQLLGPVSASVDFYALALLRDRAFLDNAVELRAADRQETTVIVAGGFHTAGMAAMLKEWGYSYVVITPRVKWHTQTDQQLYIERVLGYHPTAKPQNQDAGLPSTQVLEPRLSWSAKINEAWSLAAELRKDLSTLRLSIPPIRDIFTAMDLPWLSPVVKSELAYTRAQILKS